MGGNGKPQKDRYFRTVIVWMRMGQPEFLGNDLNGNGDNR